MQQGYVEPVGEKLASENPAQTNQQFVATVMRTSLP